MPYAGDLFVATELHGDFWILEPHGDTVRPIAVGNTLKKKGHGIEQAIEVG